MEKRIARKKFLKDLAAAAMLGVGGGLGIYHGFIKPFREKNIYRLKHFDEFPMILKHAKRVGVDSDLLMAIREAENGSDRVAYGILPQGNAREVYSRDKGYTLNGEFFNYEDEVEKQLSWAAWTVRKNKERFDANSEGFPDFISYLANKYAPADAENDPIGLNRNWEKNVRYFYDNLRSQ